MAPKPRPAIERFRGLTEKQEDGCLVWTGYIHSNGYAKHWVDGRGVLAHRWSYEYHVGPIPAGLSIDHLCRNRKCVNPEHLEPVTPAENSRRGIPNPHNAKKTHCHKGHPFDVENTRFDRGGGRICETCRSANRKQNYADNRQRYIDKAAEWQAANPERTRELAREAARRYRAKKKAA